MSWFGRTFGARPTPETEDDLIAVREAVSIGEAQVVAAKLHANRVDVWVATETPMSRLPIRWPTQFLPMSTPRHLGIPRATVLVRRADLADAEALLSEPPPWDEEPDQVP